MHLYRYQVRESEADTYSQQLIEDNAHVRKTLSKLGGGATIHGGLKTQIQHNNGLRA